MGYARDRWPAARGGTGLGGWLMGLTRSTPHGTYCVSCRVRGCGEGTPSIGVGKRRAYPARTPLRRTVYPTPVWGTADVPGYDAGPFVRSGYKWTARTTELHPDAECMHRPPQGHTPGGGGGEPASGNPPPPQPHHTTHPPKPGHSRGEHKGGNTKGNRARKGRGGSAKEGRATLSCNVSCIMRPAASGTGHRVHPFTRVHSSHSLR